MKKTTWICFNLNTAWLSFRHALFVFCICRILSDFKNSEVVFLDDCHRRTGRLLLIDKSRGGLSMKLHKNPYHSASCWLTRSDSQVQSSSGSFKVFPLRRTLESRAFIIRTVSVLHDLLIGRSLSILVVRIKTRLTFCNQLYWHARHFVGVVKYVTWCTRLPYVHALIVHVLLDPRSIRKSFSIVLKGQIPIHYVRYVFLGYVDLLFHYFSVLDFSLTIMSTSLSRIYFVSLHSDVRVLEISTRIFSFSFLSFWRLVLIQTCIREKIMDKSCQVIDINESRHARVYRMRSSKKNKGIRLGQSLFFSSCEEGSKRSGNQFLE